MDKLPVDKINKMFGNDTYIIGGFIRDIIWNKTVWVI